MAYRFSTAPPILKWARAPLKIALSVALVLGAALATGVQLSGKCVSASRGKQETQASLAEWQGASDKGQADVESWIQTSLLQTPLLMQGQLVPANEGKNGAQAKKTLIIGSVAEAQAATNHLEALAEDVARTAGSSEGEVKVNSISSLDVLHIVVPKITTEEAEKQGIVTGRLVTTPGMKIAIGGILAVVLGAGLAWWGIAGPAVDETKIQWSVKRVVFLALFADGILVSMPIAILPQAMSCGSGGPGGGNHHGNCISDPLIFALFASKSAVQLAAAPFMRAVVDMRGPRVRLLISLVLLGLSAVTFSFGLWLNAGHRMSKLSVIYPILVGARALQGIASSGVTSAGMALVSIVHPKGERGAASGFVLIGVSLGYMSGPGLGGVLERDMVSWVGFLGVAALIAVALRELPFNGCALPEELHDSDDTDQEDSTYSVYTDPLVLIVWACFLTVNGAIALLQPLVALHLSREPFNMGPQYQGLVISGGTMAFVLSTGIAGFLADQLPKWFLLLLGLLGLAVGAGIVISVKLLWVTIIGTLLCGLSMGLVDTPAMPLLTDILDYRGSKNYGRTFAVMDMVECLACMLGPAAAAVGKLFNAEYVHMMWGVSVVCLTLAPVVVQLRLVEASLSRKSARHNSYTSECQERFAQHELMKSEFASFMSSSAKSSDTDTSMESHPKEPL